MDLAALLAALLEISDTPAPKGLSQSSLRGFLALEIQTRQSGGLPKRVVAAQRREKGEVTPKVASQGIKPGGRLLREWNGVTHVVDVAETGFIWKGKTWRSLSAIAREITGAHWSGPRFFSLTGKSGS